MILNPLKERPARLLAAVLHRLLNGVRFSLVAGEQRQDEKLRPPSPFQRVYVSKNSAMGSFCPNPEPFQQGT